MTSSSLLELLRIMAACTGLVITLVAFIKVGRRIRKLTDESSPRRHMMSRATITYSGLLMFCQLAFLYVGLEALDTPDPPIISDLAIKSSFEQALISIILSVLQFILARDQDHAAILEDREEAKDRRWFDFIDDHVRRIVDDEYRKLLGHEREE